MDARGSDAWPIGRRGARSAKTTGRDGNLQVPRGERAGDLHQRSPQRRKAEVRARDEADQRRAAVGEASASDDVARSFLFSARNSAREPERARASARDPGAPACRRAESAGPGAAGARRAGDRALRRRAQLRAGPRSAATVQRNNREPREEHPSAAARARKPEVTSVAASFAGLDLLATAVVVLDDDFVVRYANPAAENLLTTGARSMIGQPFLGLFAEREDLERALEDARVIHWDYSARNVTYVRTGREPVPLSCTVTRIDAFGMALLAELRPISEQLRIEREARMESEQQANRELIRNLAHEIKNPLGGLRGSAQLLERELDQSDLGRSRIYELREYTQVIIKEADRLQLLMDRMLTPHRAPHIEPVGIHEVLERVRSLVKAEFGIDIERDYDPSLPDVHGDREQLIQAVLNIARNSAQAGSRNIVFRTRSVRQLTILRQRYRLALELQVVDDGPGVPEEIQDRVFNPLVSGREGGTGLGLSLAP